MDFVFSKNDTEEALDSAVLMLDVAQELASMAKSESDSHKKEELVKIAKKLADEGIRLSKTVKRTVYASTVASRAAASGYR